MRDAAPTDDPTPAQPDDLRTPPPVELAAALTQMAGLVLSRETVDTALELVTRLAATTTAGTLGAAVTANTGSVPEPPTIRRSSRPTPCSTSSTRARA